MTNELEKQFFDTFGIEPKRGCTAYDKFTEEEADVICDDRCRACLYFDDVYPRITPEILLELICIGTQFFAELVLLTSDNIEDLKEQVLTIYLKTAYKEKLKHQVRTLFEEG